MLLRFLIAAFFLGLVVWTKSAILGPTVAFIRGGLAACITLFNAAFLALSRSSTATTACGVYALGAG
jgi:hypothetical protein